LRAKTKFVKTGDSLLKRNNQQISRHRYALTALILRISFLCCYRKFSGSCRLDIKNCDSLKHLWALPTPTTFEKVAQTFDFGTESLDFTLFFCPTENLLNYNLPQLLTKNRNALSDLILLFIGGV
jgi:hypothetical protein